MRKGRIQWLRVAAGGHPDLMIQQQEAGRGPWMMVVQKGSGREAGAQEGGSPASVEGQPVGKKLQKGCCLWHLGPGGLRRPGLRGRGQGWGAGCRGGGAAAPQGSEELAGRPVLGLSVPQRGYSLLTQSQVLICMLFISSPKEQEYGEHLIPFPSSTTPELLRAPAVARSLT